MLCAETKSLDIFNNREIAIGVWLFVLIVLASASKSIRKIFNESFPRICRLFFSGWILIPLGLAAGYIVLVVLGLQKIGFWNSGLLKNTIFWCLSVPIVSMFRISSEDENSFWNAIKDNFKIVFVLEFTIAFYTFPFWAELLIIFAATILITMQAFTEGRKEYKSAENLLNSLIGLFGLILIFYVIYRLVADFGTFTQPGTLTDFSLPILLSLLFLPFLFIFAIFVNYDKNFRLMKRRIKDVTLRRYARHAALFGFHVHTSLLRRWIRNIQFKTPTSPSELKASITQVKKLAAREKNPVIVPLEQGWSPYRTRKFLADEGLVTSDYYQTGFDDVLWLADSQDIKVSDDILPDYISYCIEGDEHIARRLKLATVDKTRQRFLEIATQLFQKALNQEMPDEFRKKIMAEIPHNQMVEDKSVQFIREQWPLESVYSLRFIIEKTAP